VELHAVSSSAGHGGGILREDWQVLSQPYFCSAVGKHMLETAFFFCAGTAETAEAGVH
jgi:hypothetical protein